MHACFHCTSAPYRNMHYEHLQVRLGDTASQFGMDLSKLRPIPQNMLLPNAGSTPALRSAHEVKHYRKQVHETQSRPMVRMSTFIRFVFHAFARSSQYEVLRVYWWLVLHRNISLTANI